MLTTTGKVNIVHVPPNPQSALTARIIIVTDQWLKGAYGVTTGTKAAAIAGCSLPTIDAARIVLQSGDQALLAQMLAGRVSLSAAAAKLRRRVRLIESFKAASADDRAALGRMAGTATVFDDVIMPAL